MSGKAGFESLDQQYFFRELEKNYFVKYFLDDNSIEKIKKLTVGNPLSRALLPCRVVVAMAGTDTGGALLSLGVSPSSSSSSVSLLGLLRGMGHNTGERVPSAGVSSLFSSVMALFFLEVLALSTALS